MRIVDQDKGNTQTVAEFAARATGADLFEIRAETAYKDHMGLIDEAKREQQAGERGRSSSSSPETGVPTTSCSSAHPNRRARLPMPAGVLAS